MTTDEVEFERVGDEGRNGGRDVVCGEVAMRLGFEDVRWWWLLEGNGDGGAIEPVGVAMGVFCEEEAAELGTIGCLAVGTSPV